MASVHATRLKFYADAQRSVTEELLAHIAHNNDCYQVRAFRGLRWSPENLCHEILVSWEGFDEMENTWEPVSVMHEDVPHLLSQYLDANANQAIVSRIKQSL